MSEQKVEGGGGLSLGERKKSVLREYVEAIVVAVLLAIVIRTFVVQAFKIPSGSMLPTLQIGDHLLVNKFIYGVRIPFTGALLVPWKHPSHGDVIVFRFPKDRSIDYIKRVVGVPGDIVKIKKKKVYINEKPIADSHAISSPTSIMRATAGPRDYFGPITVPEGKVFVMGDNRDNSYDSRFWGFVDQKDVLGKAFLIYWSWDLKTSLFSLGRFASIRWRRLCNIID